MESKKPVKKAAKKKAAVEAAPVPSGWDDWRALALKLAIQAGWNRRDLKRVFGDGTP